MAKYHFVQTKFKAQRENELPTDRISVEYGKFEYNPYFGLFVESMHFKDNKRRMIIGNCEGSLMLIDTERNIGVNPINKLHIGELEIRRPHAESYEHHGIKGVRVDLAWFDTHYAKEMLRELELWRTPSYRVELSQQYEAHRKANGEYKWYCMPFRVKQLKISPKGLEQKITELQERVNWLRQPSQREKRRFVYETCTILEDKCRNIVIAMNHTIKGMRRTKNDRTPAIIENPDITNIADEIENRLKAVFDHICPQIDVEKAKNYWDEIALWEHQ